MSGAGKDSSLLAAPNLHGLAIVCFLFGTRPLEPVAFLLPRFLQIVPLLPQRRFAVRDVTSRRIVPLLSQFDCLVHLIQSGA